MQQKSKEEIIKQRYPFYNQDIAMKDVELNGEQVMELMESYASQFKASGGYSLEDMKNAYDSGVTEGSNQSGSFEWGIRRKDIEFKEWLASEYPTQSETK